MPPCLLLIRCSSDDINGEWRCVFGVLKETGDENTSACLLLLSSSTSAADVNEMRQITWKRVRGAERLEPSTCIIGLTWWTNTSSGGSTGFPSLLVIDINPNPMRTLNHLQKPEPARICGDPTPLRGPPVRSREKSPWCCVLVFEM